MELWGFEPQTSCMPWYLEAPASTSDPAADLLASSVNVRRCAPFAAEIVTQLVTQTAIPSMRISGRPVVCGHLGRSFLDGGRCARFWPTALLYSSAVRRQAATGCLEDTA